MTLEHMVFVGFNRWVAALDRRTGDVLWKWKAPQGTGFVSLLLDGAQLFVAVQGYIYSLDAATGLLRWSNPMKGFGTGVTSFATTRGQTSYTLLGEAHAREQAARSAAAGAGAAGASG
ncbi:MAG: PQQ-binding-like beta-propeller repeat protein [Planctomycetota bacterium]